MKKLISRFKNPVEFWFLVGGLIVSLFFFFGALNLTRLPRLFPMGASVFCLFFILMYSALRIFKKEGSQSEQAETDDVGKKYDAEEAKKEQSMDRTGKKNAALTYVFFVAYVIVTYLCGFLISVALLSVIYPLVFGYRKPVPVILCFVFCVGLVLLFQKLLGFTFSRGVLVDLSRLFF